MITVDPTRDFDYIVNRLSTDRALSLDQARDVQLHIATNCQGMDAEAIALYLSSPQPNPDPQPTVQVRTEDEVLRKLLKAGAIVEAKLAIAETEAIPDPNWEPFLPSPLQQMGFDPGTVVTLRDVEELL